jgi:hypothetical protein
VCSGNSVVLTGTTSMPNTGGYTWSIVGGTPNIGSLSTISVSPTVTTTYGVIYTNNTTQCASAPATITVTVKPTPVVSLPSTGICTGGQTTFLVELTYGQKMVKQLNPSQLHQHLLQRTR